MKQLRLVFVAGARPNFMKVAPLMRRLRSDPDFSEILVHTGQHYDDQLSGHFFRDLQLPPPDYNLGVGSGTHAVQTAEVMKRFEEVLMVEKADAAIVVGDVNSTMASAIVAAKWGLPVVHVEAGLRSFDRSMPEEINRIVTDSVSDLLLVTEESGRQNLLREGASESHIHLVGNLMIDSLLHHLDQAQQSDIVHRLGLDGRAFALVTLHRPSNVDDREQLDELLQALTIISETIPLLFPIHPRTRARLDGWISKCSPKFILLESLPYLEFLCLMSKSKVVLTDSGGVQEETTALGVPCLTLRNNTERPATIEQGTNMLAGTRTDTILAAWTQMLNQPKTGRTPPLWDGAAAQRCVAALRDYFQIDQRWSVQVAG